MEQDLKDFSESFAVFKNKYSTKTLDSNSVKTKGIQTNPNVKDKYSQTLDENSLAKHVEQRDRKILELEKTVKNLRKQADKSQKLEKDLADSKAASLRHLKEVESLRVCKIRQKEQSEKIDQLSKKLDESDRKLSDEKRTSKNLKSQYNESLHNIKQLQDKYNARNSQPPPSPIPSVSSEEYDTVLMENKSLKDAVSKLHQVQSEKKFLESDRNQMASKLNQEKEALRETYSQLLRFESILSMCPEKEQMYKMAEELMSLKQQLQTTNDFEQNGVTSQNPEILEENIRLKKENKVLRSIRDAFDKLEGVRCCRICMNEYEPLGERVRMKLRCSHVICKDCAESWLVKNPTAGCPFCSTSFAYAHLTPIHLA